jgi:hypothetical protein
MTADDPTDPEFVYLLAVKAYVDPNRPTDIERLITELRGVQTACYYLAAVIRETNAIQREDE